MEILPINHPYKKWLFKSLFEEVDITPKKFNQEDIEIITFFINQHFDYLKRKVHWIKSYYSLHNELISTLISIASEIEAVNIKLNSMLNLEI